MLSVGSIADKSNVVRTINLTAEVFLSGSAHITNTAVQIGPKDHSVTYGEGAVAWISDYTAKLMTHEKVLAVVRAPSFSGLPHMNIAAAYAAGGHFD